MSKVRQVLSLFVMAGVAAYAQTATLLGTVTDPSGSVVPSATITITNTGTNAKRVIETSATGSYIAPELPTGPYSLKAEATGFKSYSSTGIKLDSNATVRIDPVLQVGQVTENVTVAADAVNVQSDSSEVSDLISGAQIAEI